MKCKYNNLSLGYIGRAHRNAALNSQYYNLFFEAQNKTPELLNNIMVFPQRIPRRDFFIELYKLETSEYRRNFDSIISQYLNNHKKSLESLNQKNSEENARQYLNWSNILLRYGQFKQIVDGFPENYSGAFSLEIKLLRESTKIEIMLSEDDNISIDEQLELSEIFINDQKSSDREKIMLLNQIIVHFYRHQR